MLTRGKIAKKPRILEVRPLTREDLAVLTQKRAGPPAVQKLRDSHHRVARLLAAGFSDGDVAFYSGYSVQRVCTLKATPAFAELVASYRGRVDAKFEAELDSIVEIETRIKHKAAVMIEDKIDDAAENGETLPMRDLIALTADRYDRFGHPKRSIVANINMGTALERAIARSGKAVTIDAKVVPAADASRAAEVASSPSTPQPTSLMARVLHRRAS